MKFYLHPAFFLSIMPLRSRIMPESMFSPPLIGTRANCGANCGFQSASRKCNGGNSASNDPKRDAGTLADRKQAPSYPRGKLKRRSKQRALRRKAARRPGLSRPHAQSAGWNAWARSPRKLPPRPRRRNRSRNRKGSLNDPGVSTPLNCQYL